MKTLKTLLLGVALVAMPAVANAAECNLAGSAEPSILKTAGTPAQIAAGLKGNPEYPAKNCPVEELEAALIAANAKHGWTKGVVVPVDFRFSYPVIVSAPAVASEAATKFVSNEVVQSVPAAKPADTPVVKAARTKLALAEVKLAAATAEIGRLNEKSASYQMLPGTGLNSQDTARYNELLKTVAMLKTEVAGLERVIQGHSDHLAAHDRHFEVTDKRLAGVEAGLEELKNAPAAAEGFNVFGFGIALNWLALGAAVLALLAFAIAIRARLRKLPAPQPADVNISLDLSGYAKADDVAELRQQFEELSTDVADGAKDRKQIELPADLVETLKALAVGKSTDVSIGVNGKRGLIGFTKHNDTQVMAHDIDKQTQAMNIDGICSKINKAIGAGRVKMRPIATAAVA